MLRAVTNKALAVVSDAPHLARAFATGMPGANTDTLKDTIKENIKDAANKVSQTVSGVVDKAKHAVSDAKSFVHDATERIKYDQEDYADAIKAQAAKKAEQAKEMGSSAVDHAADLGDRAAKAAAAGNAAQVDAAIGGTQELHNTLSGERGPSAYKGAGADDAIKLGSGIKPGDKLDWNASGSGPLGKKGPHLATDPEGQQSSQT